MCAAYDIIAMNSQPGEFKSSESFHLAHYAYVFARLLDLELKNRFHVSRVLFDK